MAEWNYNMSHLSYGFNAPLNFRPNISLTANQFYDTSINGTHSAYQSFYGPHQPPVFNSEWFQFGSELSGSSINFSNPNTLDPWRITDQSPTVLSEPQQKWLILTNQRKSDQVFLDSFLKARLTSPSCTPSVQICEFQDLNREAQKLKDRLKEIERTDLEDPRDPREEIKERLEFVMEQIFHHSSSKELQNKLLKRKKKREWIQRKKARNRKEVTDLLAKREELSKIIDDQREVAKTREFSLIKDEEKRREADAFLGEIRRKQSETKCMQQLLQSLKDLRGLRARSLETRCALFSSEEDTTRFKNVIDKLEVVIKKQSAEHEKEELKLREIIKIHQSTKRIEDNIQKRWREHVIRKPN